MNTVIDGDLFDVIVVGTGIAGAVVAKQLGLAGRRVLFISSVSIWTLTNIRRHLTL